LKLGRVEVYRTRASDTAGIRHIKDGDTDTLVWLDAKQGAAIGPLL
jgi:hypothetical protein